MIAYVGLLLISSILRDGTGFIYTLSDFTLVLAFVTLGYGMLFGEKNDNKETKGKN